MFSKLLKGSVIALLLTLNLQCATFQQAIVTEGAERMAVVRFPMFYLRKEKDGEVAGMPTNDFEVRRQPGASPGELLFAGLDLNDDGYSDNIYAVSLDGQFNVCQVTAQDWEHAEHLQTGGIKVSAVEINESKNAAVISKKPEIGYQGKSYPRTGAAWTSRGALVSPDGKWIAVFSHTTEVESTGPGWPGLGAGGRGPGEMFVDVYDTSSGKKVAGGRARHDGAQYPDNDFEDALWVENRYLVVPLHISGRGETYLVAILP
jgi:hypothetical protein